MKTLTLLLGFCATASALAQNFTILQANEALRHGDTISLVAVDSGRWLAAAPGNETEGVVQLAPLDGGERSPTRWRVEEPAQGVYSFRCLGIGDGPMWINGLTRISRVITSPSPVGASGAGWGIYREGGGITLKCLGTVAGGRWLVGDARDNTVRLVSEEAADGATVWQVRVWSRTTEPGRPTGTQRR